MGQIIAGRHQVVDDEISDAQWRISDDETKKRVVGEFTYFENKKHCLGKGSFGEVYDGLHKLNRLRSVALKKVFIRDSVQRKEVLLEVELMKNISHPNCIKLIDVVEEDLHIYVITDLCTTNLENYLKDNAGLGDADMHLAAKQLANGYEALYDKNIIHRDIKPQNILVNVNGREFQLKIADFGCGRFMEETYAKSIKGTEKYLAPEVGAKHMLHSDSAYYDARVDIWALGLVLFECATNLFPWGIETLKQMFNAIANNQDINLYNVNLPSYLDSDLQDLLKDMLCIQYQSRIAPKTFFEHKFVTSELIGCYKYIKDKEHFLWEGTFGHVSKGITTRNNVPVCIMNVSLKYYDQQEITFLKNVVHINCVQLLDVLTNEKENYIVTELYTTNLEILLKNDDERELIRTNIESVVKQLASGYKALFQKKIVHGNITPRSVVVLKGEHEFCLKICDFTAYMCDRRIYKLDLCDDDEFISWAYQFLVVSQSKMLTPQSFITQDLDGWSDLFHKITHSKYWDFIRNVTYMSPELLASVIRKYDKKFGGREDIWSLGMVLFDCCIMTPDDEQRQRFSANVFLNAAYHMLFKEKDGEVDLVKAKLLIRRFNFVPFEIRNYYYFIVTLPLLENSFPCFYSLLCDMLQPSYSCRISPQDLFNHKLVI